MTGRIGAQAKANSPVVREVSPMCAALKITGLSRPG